MITRNAAKLRRWREKNPDKTAEYSRRYRERHRGRICWQPESIESRGGRHVITLSVDHNHATGRVRGLLCTRCNKAIGLLRDDPGHADRLAEYLRKSDGTSP